jgi:hypothetical protein
MPKYQKVPVFLSSYLIYGKPLIKSSSDINTETKIWKHVPLTTIFTLKKLGYSPYFTNLVN